MFRSEPSRLFHLLGLLLWCSLAVIMSARPAHAQVIVGSWSDGPVSGRDTTLGVTTNGSAFTTIAINTQVCTDALKVKGYRFAMFALSYTRSTGTAVTTTCQLSENNVTWLKYLVQQYDSALADGTMNLQEYKGKYTTSVSDAWPLSFPIRNVYIRCCFVATGGAAGDTLTVTARGGY
jgi:hypothetical protein